MSKGYVCGVKGNVEFVLRGLSTKFGKDFVTEDFEGVTLIAVAGQSSASEREAMKMFVEGMKFAQEN